MSKSTIEWHKIKTRPLTEEEKSEYENIGLMPCYMLDGKKPMKKQRRRRMITIEMCILAMAIWLVVWAVASMIFGRKD